MTKEERQQAELNRNSQLAELLVVLGYNVINDTNNRPTYLLLMEDPSVLKNPLLRILRIGWKDDGLVINTETNKQQWKVGAAGDIKEQYSKEAKLFFSSTSDSDFGVFSQEIFDVLQKSLRYANLSGIIDIAAIGNPACKSSIYCFGISRDCTFFRGDLTEDFSHIAPTCNHLYEIFTAAYPKNIEKDLIYELLNASDPIDFALNLYKKIQNSTN